MNISKTHLYRVWNNMKQRCHNKNNPGYESYGGRGITVCDEWRESFKAFADWAWLHGFVEPPPKSDRLWRYQHGLSIDRIDNSKGYCPENCRWITLEENCKREKANKPYSRRRKRTE